MRNMVMPAGIDAARDFDFKITDFVFQLQLVKTGGDLLRDRDRTGGCQCAIIHSGAGDDIADLSDVGRGQIM